MKNNTLLAVVALVIALIPSCVSAPPGMVRGGQYRGGHPGMASRQAPGATPIVRDFKVVRINNRTGERELVGDHVSPEDVKQYQKGQWKWGEANYFDSTGRRMPGPAGEQYAPQSNPQGYCPPTANRRGYQEMTSPTGNEFNLDQGGRNYPGPHPRLEYIYTRDPRPYRQ